MFYRYNHKGTLVAIAHSETSTVFYAMDILDRLLLPLAEWLAAAMAGSHISAAGPETSKRRNNMASRSRWNPASGMPMVAGMRMDVAGNIFGMGAGSN